MKYYNDMVAIQAKFSSSYGELQFNGAIQTSLTSSTAWKDFYQSALAVPWYTKQPVSMVYTTETVLSTSVIHTCSNITATDLFVTSLLTPSNSTVSVACGGSVWTSRFCNSIPSFCLNCSNPCVEACASSSVVNSVLTPCSSTPLVKVLGVNFVDKAIPIITILGVSRSKTSLTVSTSASNLGTVFCNAIDVSSTTEITSVSQIVSGNHLSSISSSYSSTVDISGLSPSTSYNVYCAGRSIFSDFSNIAVVLNTQTLASTLCCKTVSVYLSKSVAVEGVSLLSAVSLTLDYAPSSSLSVALSSISSQNVSNSLLPAAVVYSSLSKLTATSLSIAGFSSTGLGHLKVSLDGASVSEYSVVYTGFKTIDVAAAVQPPSVPILLSVAFVSSGNALLVTFDSPTNYGGQTTSFSCSKLFTFRGSAGTKCLWTSTTLVTVSLDSTSTVLVGDTFNMTAGLLTASCPATLTCAFAPKSSTKILGTTNPVQPKITLKIPSSISTCSSFTIDLSTSSGSGGRQWKSVSVSAASLSRLNSNVTKINSLLKSVSISPPTTIPKGVLAAGSYSFTAVLCNFLDQCDFSIATVAIVDAQSPTLVLFGDQYKTTTRPVDFQLTSDAYVQSCLSSTLIRNTILRSWSVYKNNVLDSTVVSTKGTASTFALNAFTFQTNTLYEIRLSVSLTSSTVSPQVASAFVTVIPSSVVAVIDGTSTTSVRLLTSKAFSAAGSYDEDIYNTFGSNAGLTFSWACYQSEPLSASCGLDFATLSGVSVTAVANERASLTTSVVTLTATSTDLRYRTATVTVVTIAAGSPLVTLSYTGASKVLSTNSLTLTGTVSHFVTSSAVWTVSDSSLDLTKASIVSPTTTLAGSSTNGVTLSLSPDVLTAGSTLTFTLTCTSIDLTTSSSSVVIEVNTPPQPGSFAALPTSGYAMSDLFVLSASNWISSELPLLFEFGFIFLSGGSYVRLRTRSEAQFHQSILPLGPTPNIYLVAIIHDSLGSSANMSSSIAIKEFVLSPTDLDSYLSSQISLAGGYADVLVESLATGASSLNYANCSLAPNCQLLNRGNCSSVQNTCGSCLADYYGDYGDANSVCIPVASANRQRLLAAQSVSTKMCVNNCSSHGDCTFVNINTYRILSTCLVGDGSCAAVCSCASGFNGASCSTSDSDLIIKQNSRDLLVNALSSLVESQVLDAIEVSYFIESLATLTQNMEEISNLSSPVVFNFGAQFLELAAGLNIPVSDLASILTVLDSFAGSLAVVVRSGSRRLSSSTDSIASMLTQFAQLALQQMVTGQANAQFIYSKFTINAAASESSQQAALSAVLTPSEVANGVVPSAVSFSTTGGLDSLKLALVTFRSSIFGSESSNFNSNPVLLVLDEAISCNSTEECHLVSRLSNNDATSYPTDATELAAPYHTVHCKHKTVATTNFSCPSGLDASASCNGTWTGSLTVRCPYFITVPVCQSFIGEDGLAEWAATGYNSVSTNCSLALDSNSSFLDSGHSWEVASSMSRSAVFTNPITVIETPAKKAQEWALPLMVVLCTVGVFIIGFVIWKWMDRVNPVVDGSDIALKVFYMPDGVIGAGDVKQEYENDQDILDVDEPIPAAPSGAAPNSTKSTDSHEVEFDIDDIALLIKSNPPPSLSKLFQEADSDEFEMPGAGAGAVVGGSGPRKLPHTNSFSARLNYKDMNFEEASSFAFDNPMNLEQDDDEYEDEDYEGVEGAFYEGEEEDEEGDNDNDEEYDVQDQDYQDDEEGDDDFVI
jgi:hypothetical protein